MPVSSWSTSAAANSAAPPNGWPEGMAPSTVNDTGRQMMADLRARFEDAEWMEWGDACTYAGAASFTVPGDVTARYHPNRRIRAAGTATGTVYGTIAAAAFGGATTAVTVVWDAGGLQNETLAVALGIVSGDAARRSVDRRAVAGLGTLAAEDAAGVAAAIAMASKPIDEAMGAAIASAATTDIAAATGNYVVVTGTATIGALGTAQAGTRRIVAFDGAGTITHDPASLILPGAADIARAAGDVATFVSEGGGNWRCAGYMRADGRAVAQEAPVLTAYAESIQKAISAFGDDQTITEPHGLGGEPKDVWAYILCTSTDLGYSVGTKIRIGSATQGPSASTAAVMLVFDAENFKALIDKDGIYLRDVTSGSQSQISYSKWKLVFRGIR